MLRWYKAEKVWSTEWGNSLAFRASYLTGVDAGVQHPRGAGLQGFPSILLGPPSTATKMTTTARLGIAGPPFPGEWHHGDIVYNSNPAAGGYIGWVWVASASAWKRFGAIEP